MGEVVQRVVPFKADALNRDAEKSPHSVAAEQALLGAIMINNRFFDELDGRLTPDHFYVPLHAAMFEAMDAIINMRGGEANPITIKERLDASKYGDEKELFSTLNDMFSHATLSTDAKSLGEVIVTTYRQRQLMGLGQSITTEARKAQNAETVESLLESAGSEVFRLTEVGGPRSHAWGMKQNVLEVLRQAEAAKTSGTGLIGVGSGIPDLDDLLSGFQKSDLIILGARPSMGKTSLLLNFAQVIAARHLGREAGGCPVGVFSLEMNAVQLTQRLLSNVTNINTQDLGSGKISDGDLQRLVAGGSKVQSLPLYLDDTPALTLAAFRSKARRMKRQHGIGLLLVDYLQLLRCPLKGDFNRVQEISEITMGLKQIARELDVPVIAASQLSRQVESRDNKRPLLSDLRESGSIEQDADVVMFLYREDYYLSKLLGAADESTAATDADRRKLTEARDRLQALKGISELLVSKNRKGPTGTVKLMFDEVRTTFSSYSSRKGSSHAGGF